MTLEEKLRNLSADRVAAERLLQLRAERRSIEIRAARWEKMRQEQAERFSLEAEQLRRVEELRDASRHTLKVSKAIVPREAEPQTEPSRARPTQPEAERKPAKPGPNHEEQSKRESLRTAATRRDEALNRNQKSAGQVRGEKSRAHPQRSRREESSAEPPLRISEEIEAIARHSLKKQRRLERTSSIGETPPDVLASGARDRLRKPRPHRQPVFPEDPTPVPAIEIETDKQAELRASLRRDKRRQLRKAMLEESTAHEAQSEPRALVRQQASSATHREDVGSATPAIDIDEERRAEVRASLRRDKRREIRQAILQESTAYESQAEARTLVRQASVLDTHREEATAVSEGEVAEPEDETAAEEAVPGLLPLRTCGSFVVNENQEPVHLRGVTVVGLDSLALDSANLALLRRQWGANVIRLRFEAQAVLAGSGLSPPDQILAALDEIVSAANGSGAYALLSLTPPLDDVVAAQAWQILAARYKYEPGVLYELCSSPEPVADDWLQRAAVLVGSIRQQSQAALIFLGSGKGGGDCTGLPLRFATGAPVFNIVYTISVSSAIPPNPDDGGLRNLCESWPVFASGWLDGEDSVVDRLAGPVADMLARYGIGFAASNWNADPRLVADASGHDLTPTGWGSVVQRAITLPVRPLLRPFAP